jgi:hypothetical protein
MSIDTTAFNRDYFTEITDQCSNEVAEVCLIIDNIDSVKEHIKTMKIGKIIDTYSFLDKYCKDKAIVKMVKHAIKTYVDMSCMPDYQDIEYEHEEGNGVISFNESLKDPSKIKSIYIHGYEKYRCYVDDCTFDNSKITFDTYVLGKNGDKFDGGMISLFIDNMIPICVKIKRDVSVVSNYH